MKKVGGIRVVAALSKDWKHCCNTVTQQDTGPQSPCEVRGISSLIYLKRDHVQFKTYISPFDTPHQFRTLR